MQISSDQIIKSYYKIQSKVRRTISDSFSKRILLSSLQDSYISFTFDDFPVTAAVNGAKSLENFGKHGTFYCSLGLLNSNSPSGKICSLQNIEQLLNSGHEIGCHTFDHLNSWENSANSILKSTILNKQIFEKYFPDYSLESFAYPISGPKPYTKKIIGTKFLSCRGGGQKINQNSIDLNLLKSYFLDWRNIEDFISIKDKIDLNEIIKGWLIFATHDVSSTPSRYGCDIDLFTQVVKYACKSSAHILPVSKVYKKLTNNIHIK